VNKSSKTKESETLKPLDEPIFDTSYASLGADKYNASMDSGFKKN